MDFNNTAIVIIYADGMIDSIPIEEDEFEHTKYYEKLLSISERFKSICGICNFQLGIHFHIDRLLAKNGAIIFQNWNIREIIASKMNGESYSELPDFVIYYPTQFGSQEQLKEYEKITNNYPKTNLVYYKYINDDLGFTDNYSNFDLQNEIDEFKNELERRN